MLDIIQSETSLTTAGKMLREQNYLVFNQAVSSETCGILAKRVKDLFAKNDLMKCRQCPSSFWAYDDQLFQVVHDELRLTLSEKLGINLLNSFSSVRYYPRGEVLKKHLDREAAEFVLSLTIDFQGEQLWPLYLQEKTLNEDPQQINLNIGEAVLFQGAELYHWREPLENEWQIQAFFFFVDANGEFKAHAGDLINKYKPRDPEE